MKQEKLLYIPKILPLNITEVVKKLLFKISVETHTGAFKWDNREDNDKADHGTRS